MDDALERALVEGLVVMSLFDDSLEWIALTPTEARAFAETLRATADVIERGDVVEKILTPTVSE